MSIKKVGGGGPGELDLGLCMLSGLAERIWLCSDDFQFLNMFGRKIFRNLTSLRLRSNSAMKYHFVADHIVSLLSGVHEL